MDACVNVHQFQYANTHCLKSISFVWEEEEEEEEEEEQEEEESSNIVNARNINVLF